MLTLILAFMGGGIKKALSSPLVIVGVLIIIALFIGRFWGKASCERAVQKEVIRELKVYVERKDRVREKYAGNKFSDEQTLSGCIAESLKNQPHCGEVK